jgi:hypothetical protein
MIWSVKRLRSMGNPEGFNSPTSQKKKESAREMGMTEVFPGVSIRRGSPPTRSPGGGWNHIII